MTDCYLLPLTCNAFSGGPNSWKGTLAESCLSQPIGRTSTVHNICRINNCIHANSRTQLVRRTRDTAGQEGRSSIPKSRNEKRTSCMGVKAKTSIFAPVSRSINETRRGSGGGTSETLPVVQCGSRSSYRSMPVVCRICCRTDRL